MNIPASTAPKAIYLDIGDRAALESIEAGGPWETEGVTWSEDNATGDGIRYVRADLASTASAITDEQIMDAVSDLAADGGRWPSDWIEAVRRGIALAAPTTQPTGQAVEPSQPAPDFEKWLRQKCITAPSPQAYDLAKSAYAFGLASRTPAPAAPSEPVARAIGDIAKLLCWLLDEEEWEEVEPKIAIVCTALQMPAAIASSTKAT